MEKAYRSASWRLIAASFILLSCAASAQTNYEPYTFSTFAGVSPGFADGTGSAARFHLPSSVAMDGAGNLFVADSQNNTIRKITAGGVVTTLAGSPGQPGSADGTGSAARFDRPLGVAVDSAGNVYVADDFSEAIR